MEDARIGPINDIIFNKADEFAREVYRETFTFPKEELYGVTSQLRRAVLSVPLNITEGYARISMQDHRRFLEISYGSLKEVKYLLYFSLQQKYISSKTYEMCIEKSEELCRMLWRKINTIRAKTQK